MTPWGLLRSLTDLEDKDIVCLSLLVDRPDGSPALSTHGRYTEVDVVIGRSASGASGPTSRAPGVVVTIY